MKRILIVEDDPAIVVGLHDFIRSMGYEVLVARDGEQAITLFNSTSPDLVLLDLVLPKRSGTEVCRMIRERGDKTPIIMVTAKGQVRDRIAGLNLGADDYVTKPFDLAELMARIRAVIRRTDEEDISRQMVYQLGNLQIDLEQYTIDRDGQQYQLSAREREILSLLIDRQGQVVTRNDILNHVWGTDSFPTTRTIDNYIVSLRKKLESDPSSPQLLISVRSAGYKLVNPDLADPK
ncbi:MAG: response regulator transcription factor [Planctomycetota bacterium]